MADSGAKVQDETVDRLLFGFLEHGRLCRQRAGHGEACGPRRATVRSVSTACSQLPQACWLELGACDETGTSFSNADFQKFHPHVRDFLNFNFAVFTSALHAPDAVFGECTVLCNVDDVVLEPAVQVNGERTQDVKSQSTIAQPRKRRPRQTRLSSSSPCLNLLALATTFQDAASKPQTGK